jgi:glycine dehydrogenase subunit 1
MIMAKEKSFIHPYIPNSVPGIKAEMLKTIGVKNVEALYQQIPDKLRFKRKLNLPKPFLAEQDLKKHIINLLSKNKTCEENLNFLGGGCWQHYVPAVCDEIAGRSEVLTAYAGDGYSDHGKFQLLFEYQSELAELVGMDVVSLPIYSWGSAAGHAMRMASRITGRDEVLLSKATGPERLAVIRIICQPVTMPGHIDVKLVGYNLKAGLLDIEDLKRQISSKTAAVYIENPSYLGFIETQGQEIADIAHTNGALSIVGVDPISLGVLAPPSDYGADLIVGTVQSLGVHMNCGGGEFGFIASSNEEKYVTEHPALLVSLTNTEEGEYGFYWSTWDRTSYCVRDDFGHVRSESKDYTGTVSNLWAISAAVYMALMGPEGFKEIGELIIQKSHHAMKLLSAIKGVKILLSPNIFKEFVVNFDDTGKKVRDINKALLKYNIFGGKDISNEFPALGNSALYCVTEIHSQGDIEKLADVLKEVLEK